MSASQRIKVVEGDLLKQDVEVIVNTWNRNLIPWWLLLPQGVSGAIRRRAGKAPFQELRKYGVLPLGGAALTGAGKLPFKGIIHVAGLNHCWMTSELIIRKCVRSALTIANEKKFKSLAFPLIGAGTGGMSRDVSLRFMLEEVENSTYGGRALLIKFGNKK